MRMNTVRLKLVTIIAEAVIEERLLDDLRRLGAKGYTILAAQGEGTRGIRASDWEARNVRIETVVSAPVAEAILECLAREYFDRWAVIGYVSDVDVVRGDKYV
jgi:hypothetical protein